MIHDSTVKVTILIPTYEPKPEHLSQALDSVLAQTMPDWELLIHDDASKASVEEIMKPYLKDPRIRYIRSPQNRGIGGNWNAALEQAGKETPYVQYLFQDDWWTPLYLERTMETADRYPMISFVSAAHAYVCEDGIVNAKGYDELLAFKNEHLRPGLLEGRAFLRWWIDRGLHPNVIGEPSFLLMRRDCLEKAGPFCEDMPQFLDVDMWIRLLMQGDWYYIADSIGSFRVHADGASMQNFTSGRGVFDRFRCFERLIKALPEGPEKELAIRGQKQILDQMVWKFFDRVSHGRPVKAGGSGAVRRFMMRHPMITIRVVTRVVLMMLWRLVRGMFSRKGPTEKTPPATQAK